MSKEKKKGTTHTHPHLQKKSIFILLFYTILMLAYIGLVFNMINDLLMFSFSKPILLNKNCR